ncbi:MAG TPA: hypothetical protein VKM55_15420 [Candidatus Lokiarchaeia archaeon]|nr:hypothetical protein [Candidatus Lokiarchaeia archaeon]
MVETPLVDPSSVVDIKSLGVNPVRARDATWLLENILRTNASF